MFIKRCWQWLCLTSKSKANTNLSGECLAATPNNCARWRHGSLEQEAEEVVMESTAQYWKPVWEALERYWKPIREKREGARRKSGTLHLAQAQSNRGRRGRKRDFVDAERLVKRLVARELTLSFVPDAEQRLWRTVTRKKYQLRCDRVRLQNQVESLAGRGTPQVVQLGLGSAGRQCPTDAEGARRRGNQPGGSGRVGRSALARHAGTVVRRARRLYGAQRRLPAAAEDGVGGVAIDRRQIGQLDQEMASLLSQHQDAVERLAEVPGLGVDSAQQIIAEVGPTAATFPSEKRLSSWVGCCPGDNESAG